MCPPPNPPNDSIKMEEWGRGRMKMGGVTLGGGEGGGEAPKMGCYGCLPPPKDLMEVSNVPPPPQKDLIGAPNASPPPVKTTPLRWRNGGGGKKGGLIWGGGKGGRLPHWAVMASRPPPPKRI